MKKNDGQQRNLFWSAILTHRTAGGSWPLPANRHLNRYRTGSAQDSPRAQIQTQAEPVNLDDAVDLNWCRPE